MLGDLTHVRLLCTMSAYNWHHNARDGEGPGRPRLY